MSPIEEKDLKVICNTNLDAKENTTMPPISKKSGGRSNRTDKENCTKRR